MSTEPLPTAHVNGEHYWLSHEQMLEHWPSLAKHDWVSCLWCGKVKRNDGGNAPCNGPINISLRKREPLIVEVPTVLSRIETLRKTPARAKPGGGR